MRLLQKRVKQSRISKGDLFPSLGTQERSLNVRERRPPSIHQGEIIMQPTGILETSKATNPLKALLSYGQSMWLDYIRRDLITGGGLKKLIEEDGLRGMTSNPSIFYNAIADSSLYGGVFQS